MKKQTPTSSLRGLRSSPKQSVVARPAKQAEAISSGLLPRFRGDRHFVPPRNDRVGFTLVELLVTAAILGIISMAVISSFAGGLKVYERVRNYAGTEGDALLALEKMERDLRNAVELSEIDFEGDRKSLSFAALITSDGGIRSRRRKDAEKTPSLGKILYYVKGARDNLIREEKAYPYAVSKTSRRKGNTEELVSLKRLNFSYYYYDRDMKEYKWKDSWKVEEDEDEEEGLELEDKDRVPLAVKMSLTFKKDAGENVLTRTVLLPVGYKGWDPARVK